MDKQAFAGQNWAKEHGFGKCLIHIPTPVVVFYYTCRAPILSAFSNRQFGVMHLLPTKARPLGGSGNKLNFNYIFNRFCPHKLNRKCESSQAVGVRVSATVCDYARGGGLHRLRRSTNVRGKGALSNGQHTGLLRLHWNQYSSVGVGLLFLSKYAHTTLTYVHTRGPTLTYVSV